MPRTRLAWHNLTHSPRRLALALAGVNFAVLLMFVQVGFQYALLESTVQVLEELDGQIVILSKAQYAMPAQQRFDRQRLWQAAAVPGVRAARPLYLEAFMASWRLAEQPGRPTKAYPIRVIAFDPAQPVVRLPEVCRQVGLLRRPGTALFDRKSKAIYGVPPSDEAIRALHGATLSGRPVRLVGGFDLGTDFTYDGNLITSAANFARYFPLRGGGDPLGVVDVGVVQVSEPAAVPAVRDRLRRRLPGDVLVLTKEEAIAREMGFWQWGTPIGTVFLTGMIIGFVVGVIICYQILYADIADHLAELATLRAMGYTRGYLVRFVLELSFYLSVLAYLPGLLVSLVLYQLVAGQTGLAMELTLGRGLFVFLATLGMCVVSGGLALRKVLAADPADLF